MSRIKLRYVQGFVDRKVGRVYFYFRRPGFPHVRLPGLPGSDEFMAAYQQALAATPAPIGQAKRSKPGSVSAAIASYLDSALYFGSRGEGTRAQQRAILERFRESYGELPLATLPPKMIAALLANKRPGAARNTLKALRAFCAFAKAQGLIREDPTRDVKLPAAKSPGHHAWTDEEIAQYEGHHPIGSKARLAFALLLYTVQRRSDVIRLGPQHVRDGAIHLRGQLRGQKKTGKPMVIPIRSELRAVLDATPHDHLTFLVTKTGQPYAASDFSKQFAAWRGAAGLPPNCRAHGLRKAACRRMAEAGYSANEIAAWSGHATLAEIKRYTDAADQARLARQALAREQTGSGSVKPDEPQVSNSLKSLQKIRVE
jgi:integrase